jgi:hypothetical protein
MNDNETDATNDNDNDETDDDAEPVLGWNVGRLRAALADLPDDLEIVVHAKEERDDGDTHVCGGIYGTSLGESHADGKTFLSLHVSDAAEDFFDVET